MQAMVDSVNNTVNNFAGIPPFTAPVKLTVASEAIDAITALRVIEDEVFLAVSVPYTPAVYAPPPYIVPVPVPQFDSKAEYQSYYTTALAAAIQYWTVESADPNFVSDETPSINQKFAKSPAYVTAQADVITALNNINVAINL
jgi:hypothetical protein